MDICLQSSKGKTVCSGASESCRSRKKEVAADPHLKTLMDIMFKAGWYWYCEELWHFEYSQNPLNSLRVTSY